MARLTLTNQQSRVDIFKTYLNTFRGMLLDRLPLWRKVSLDKKKAWVKSGKDPVVTLAWKMYTELKDFFGMDADHDA